MKMNFRRSEEGDKRIDEARQLEENMRTEEPEISNPNNEEHTQPEMGLFEFGSEVVNELRSRWSSIQAQFVDQPCASIEQADALVAEALDRIQKMLLNQQETLRDRWYNHEDVSTEDLRLTLQDYRTFLNSLLDQ